MRHDLQPLADLSTILALGVSILSLLVSIIVWVWKEPSEFVRRIRPVMIKILIGISLISIGFFISSVFSPFLVQNNEPFSGTGDEGILEIDSIPFSANGWVSSELPSEIGWASFSLVNGSDNTRSYKLDFTLPTTATNYSGGGIAFSFPEPLDLTDYEFIEVDITFGCDEVRCNLDMRDISGKAAAVPLGPGVSYDEDIEVRLSGTTQTVLIPLEDHFGEVNRKVIQDMGFSVSAEQVRGYHYFIINEIKFVRKGG